MTDADNTPVSPESLARKHESQDQPIGKTLLAAGIIVLMTAACLGIVWLMMSAFSRTRPETTRPPAEIVAPGAAPLERTAQPYLQVNPKDDLATFRAREDVELNSYGWINRTAGVVRIPIDRAMELIVERGLPLRSTNAAGKSDVELIRERSEKR